MSNRLVRICVRFGGPCARDATVKAIGRSVVSAPESLTTAALASPAPASPGLVSPAVLSPAVVSPAVSSLVRRWWPVAAVAGAGLLVGDGLIHLGGVIGGGTSFSLAAAAALGLWLARPRQKFGLVDTDLQGWQKRLDGLLEQFQALDAEDPARLAHLEDLRQQLQRSDPQLALVGLQPPPLAMQQVFSEALRGRWGFTLHWSEALPRWSEHWRWPERFTSCELLIHHLQMPLSAAELRWMEALPKGQPLWLLVEADVADPNQVRLELSSQLPELNSDQLLLWNGQVEAVAACLEPLNRLLHQQAPKLRQDTRLRQLRDLHSRWQADLELLRRERFEALQQRTQWLVAAGVFATPIPSLDLLVLAVANGLMLQEMARLWQCGWTMAQLRAAAAELARACLALGVVEWSSQTLAGLLKWHGATWLVGGAMQALSAAYLTRVVGRAMADVLALSSGVSEPDLERIKREAPLIVARAAESEKLDWQAFLQQGRQWLTSQAA
jgi:hypothetical protein